MTSGGLNFDSKTLVAKKGLGGLDRDLFGHGRLFAAVSRHGGLTAVSYWGRQHLGAARFFQGDPESPWIKLFRVYARVGEKLHYLTLRETRLYPFGYTSHGEIDGIKVAHDLLLLPDALVQRFQIEAKESLAPIRIEALHQESCTCANGEGRTWTDFQFDANLNALIASCTDLEPEGTLGDIGLAQQGIETSSRPRPKATTWIGLGCDSALKYHRGYHARSKHYLAGSPLRGKSAALFLVFATSRRDLEKRLKELSGKVHQECNELLKRHEKRLAAAPQIDTGNAVLNSAFAQYPECMNAMRLPDCVGAIRATLAGYFVWGWDGLTAPFAFNLANEAEASAEILRFYQDTLDPKIGIPHSFSTDFSSTFRGPFPSQAQFIAALYHHVAATGDLSLAKELMPTCTYILDRCRERIVKDSGLVEGHALWPDFPEAMEENGHDISSMNNSILYQGLRSMEFLAQALGDIGLAEESRVWAGFLRKSFVKYLYDEEKGFFISSCDSRDFTPRRHYCPQSVFWLTPFAGELVSHAPKRIAEFMDEHLRHKNCLLTLPRWDKAWMADGNQLGSTYPAADSFYLNVQKLVGNGAALTTWSRDVEWFWKSHTVPEAFTPEAENEMEMGVDNPGFKQLQACATWYLGFYYGLAGLDFDHEGITFSPSGNMALSVTGLRLRGISIDLKISGSGNQIGSLKLNGKALSCGSRKIAWQKLKGKTARIELVRTKRIEGPVIVRADGLGVAIIKSDASQLRAKIKGVMSGEIRVQAQATAKIKVDGNNVVTSYDEQTGVFTIPLRAQVENLLEISL